METKTDAQLLREYASGKSEASFAELVHRHAGLVYSAALRQTGSAHAADEIAQTVFIDLARKARSLANRMRPNTSLAGWLYRATRYAALNLLREERRRHVYENQVMQEFHSTSESAPDWAVVAPLLDEALTTLNEEERDALLLRFFKKMDFRSVGAALGVTDDAAQKRVTRSLEKLRAALLRRGVTTTTTALSVALLSQAVDAVPTGLEAGWITASVAGATAASGTTLTLIKLMSLTKIQLGVGAIVIGGLAFTVAVQQQTGTRMIAENQALQKQVADLGAANENLSNRLQDLNLSRRLPTDLERENMRLRGEIGLLREKTNMLGRAVQVDQLRSNERRDAAVSEGEVKVVAAKAYTEHRQDVVNAAKQLGLAFRIYINDNNNQIPTNLADMHNELANTTNFSGDIPLDSFELVNVGKINPDSPQTIWLMEKTPQQSPNGGWDRVAVLVDGSVHSALSTDGNFYYSDQENAVNNSPQPNQ